MFCWYYPNSNSAAPSIFPAVCDFFVAYLRYEQTLHFIPQCMAGTVYKSNEIPIYQLPIAVNKRIIFISFSTLPNIQALPLD